MPIERTAFLAAGEQGYWMLQCKKHIWKLANSKETHQITRRLEQGTYIARCRHADGTPYRPQIPGLGRTQLPHDRQDTDAPAAKKLRVSAYSLQRSPQPTSEREAESSGRSPPETS